MKPHWLVRPDSIRLLWIVFVCILALTVLAGLFMHPHAAFGIDGSFGFYAWFGLVSCIAMIVVAKLLALLLKRKDSYYDGD